MNCTLRNTWYEQLMLKFFDWMVTVENVCIKIVHLKKCMATVNAANVREITASGAVLQPSFVLHVQYSINMLYVPVRIKQNLSSPSIPGSPKYAQLRKYLHFPCTATK